MTQIAAVSAVRCVMGAEINHNGCTVPCQAGCDPISEALRPRLLGFAAFDAGEQE